MNALRQHLVVSLKLYLRNKMALAYGYVFPILFLIAFWVLYRYERVPLVRHMGELLTVTVLGSSCFGLPTTLVSERERGVWRRYRLVPGSTVGLVCSTLVARYLSVLGAAVLQIALAVALGMPLPAHPFQLGIAFSVVTFAFLGLGLVIAMMADNVPAVQALGQTIFLPMLIIGGVAVQLSSLPDWALHISAFFPGRYAVQALQSCVNGPGLGSVGFSLVALIVIGAAALAASAGLFRWDTNERFLSRPGKAWVGVALVAWIAVGLAAEARGQIALLSWSRSADPSPSPAASARSPAPSAGPSAVEQPGSATVHTDAGAQQCPSAPPTWSQVTIDMIDADLVFDRGLPPDMGPVTPIGREGLEPRREVAGMLQELDIALRAWPPGKVEDPVQRVRNLMWAAGVPDIDEMEIEWWAPHVVFARVKEAVPQDQLVQILYWIVCHPYEGTTPTAQDLRALNLPGLPDDMIEAHNRVAIYSHKLLGRLLGRIR